MRMVEAAQRPQLVRFCDAPALFPLIRGDASHPEQGGDTPSGQWMADVFQWGQVIDAEAGVKRTCEQCMGAFVQHRSLGRVCFELPKVRQLKSHSPLPWHATCQVIRATNFNDALSDKGPATIIAAMTLSPMSFDAFRDANVTPVVSSSSHGCYSHSGFSSGSRNAWCLRANRGDWSDASITVSSWFGDPESNAMLSVKYDPFSGHVYDMHHGTSSCQLPSRLPATFWEHVVRGESHIRKAHAAFAELFCYRREIGSRMSFELFGLQMVNAHSRDPIGPPVKCEVTLCTCDADNSQHDGPEHGYNIFAIATIRSLCKSCTNADRQCQSRLATWWT